MFQFSIRFFFVLPFFLLKYCIFQDRKEKIQFFVENVASVQEFRADVQVVLSSERMLEKVYASFLFNEHMFKTLKTIVEVTKNIDLIWVMVIKIM